MKKYYISILMSCALWCINGQINSNSPAKPFNSNSGYTYGIMPTNLPSGGTYGKSNDAANAYNSWKTNFVRTCSNGSRVLFDDNSSTVSEGIAYGMLLSAYAGDKPLFDELWKFYKANTNGNGVMNWKLSGCSGVSGQNGATDAELDAAMALLVAADQWPSATSPYNYKNEATALIGKIRQFEMHPSSHQTLNGDAWGTGNSCRNPSYFSPAYYREYAKAEPSQASFWNSAVSASNSFLLTNRNSTTGLVSNWADNNASPNNCNGPNEYGFDACRNPWRMATDILWNGTSTATTASDICNKVSNWLKGNESNLKGPLQMNASNPSAGQYKNGTFSTYALAVMGTSSANQSSLNSCYTNVVGLGNESIYFNATLRCVTLFMMTGNFWKPGSAANTATVSITAPANNATFAIGASVSFTATATTSSGSVTKVEYYDGSTLLGSATSSPFSFSTTSLTAGIHTITAKSYNGSTLLATSGGVIITITSPSDISTTGVVDMFESKTAVSEITGGFNTTSCSGIATAATAGINWFEDRNTSTAFKAEATRAGDGKLSYLISQAANSYNAIGFNFGEYCNNGTKTKYTLDLSQNAVLKMSVSTPSTNTTSLELKIQVKDLDGTVLAFNKNVLTTAGAVNTADWYKYEIGFNKNHVTPDYTSLVKGSNVNFEFDLKNALTVKDPSVSNAANINTNNTDFDFKNVAEVLMLVVSSTDNGSPNYQPNAFTDQTLVFSNLTLGNASLGTNICTTPAAPIAGTVAALCQGATAPALTATGTTGLNLQWYGTASSGGTASTTATVPSTTNAGSATYYVSQKVGTGTCEGPRTPIAVTVTTAAVPSVTITSVPSGNVNQGTNITFSTSVTNGGNATTYQWRKNGSNIPNETSSSYSSSTLANNDAIDVVITSNASCASPTTATSNKITVSILTSIEDILFANLELYPNPAQDFLNVNGLNGEFEYSLVDNLGKQVIAGTSQNVVNLNGLTAGYYTMIIKIDGKQKIVKVTKN